MLEAGITNTETTMVTEQNTALALGSGTVEVFATPAMINLIEYTCARSVENELEAGQTTVGTNLNISQSELVKVDGRALSFEVEVVDEQGIVGRGTHDRFIVDKERFQSKANAKLNK